MSKDDDKSYHKYYDLETYLFETVGERFHRDGSLSAFDFFCIVIWKANRAKSNIARRLLRHEGVADLEEAARKLTGAIATQPSPEARLNVLMKEWGFLLPMASAILTVLYPNEFTVYDYRVRKQVGCRDLGSMGPRHIWPEYQSFKRKVEEMPEIPAGLSLRDKDRFLSGKSFCEQLKDDISKSFGVP